MTDNEDGSYSIFFTPTSEGMHTACIKVFGRPIKDNPIVVEVLNEHNPDVVYGSRGAGRDEFCQPVGIAIDPEEQIFVADTGNSRIKVVSPRLQETRHIVGEALEGRSVTGITLTATGSS